MFFFARLCKKKIESIAAAFVGSTLFRSKEVEQVALFEGDFSEDGASRRLVSSWNAEADSHSSSLRQLSCVATEQRCSHKARDKTVLPSTGLSPDMPRHLMKDLIHLT